MVVRLVDQDNKENGRSLTYYERIQNPSQLTHNHDTHIEHHVNSLLTLREIFRKERECQFEKSSFSLLILNHNCIT
jgi:hypothetical protein